MSLRRCALIGTAALSVAGVVAMAAGWAPRPAVAAAIPGGSCPGRDLPADPLQLYGERMLFTVLRDGTPVGTHTVDFRREGRDLIVDSRFDVTVKLLFVTAYSFRYEATDRWRDGCLVDLRAITDDDGTRSAVTAALENGALRVVGPAGSDKAPAEIFPTHHWNAGVVGSQKILNTITGKVGSIGFIDGGIEPVEVNGQRLPARRYAYSGDLENEVWYDAQGRWVKMRFAGKDGSTIEYRCESCARSLTAQP